VADRPSLILASESPRRLALLKQVGLAPDEVIAPDIDEAVRATELPRALALRLASEKAISVSVRVKSGGKPCVILAADTVVACGRRCLGKPEDPAEAQRFLTLLSGRSHQVFSGVSIMDANGNSHQRVVMTRVKFKRLSDDDMTAYLATGEWKDKAGAYAIQGFAGAFVKSINGSYSNVVGLPLLEVVQMLGACGIRGETPS